MRSLSEIEVGEAGVDDDVGLVDGATEGDAIERPGAAEGCVGLAPNKYSCVRINVPYKSIN